MAGEDGNGISRRMSRVCGDDQDTGWIVRLHMGNPKQGMARGKRSWSDAKPGNRSCGGRDGKLVTMAKARIAVYLKYGDEAVHLIAV